MAKRSRHTIQSIMKEGRFLDEHAALLKKVHDPAQPYVLASGEVALVEVGVFEHITILPSISVLDWHIALMTSAVTSGERTEERPRVPGLISDFIQSKEDFDSALANVDDHMRSRWGCALPSSRAEVDLLNGKLESEQGKITQEDIFFLAIVEGEYHVRHYGGRWTIEFVQVPHAAYWRPALHIGGDTYYPVQLAQADHSECEVPHVRLYR